MYFHVVKRVNIIDWSQRVFINAGMFENFRVKQTNASKRKPMHLMGDISVVDMGIDKATILKFVLLVSEFCGVVTAVLSLSLIHI